jgi:DNA modification methylase
MTGVRILIGDCLIRMKELPDNSVDSVVCDPPYHLTSIVKRFGSADAAPCKVGKTGAYARASKGFMGQTWDGGDVAFRPETWAEVLRVLKPGGHLVAFSGTRTYHRMAVAIEDAGFEIRDMIAWHYGSGFPKSHDISKAIDRARDDKSDWQRVGAFLKAARGGRNMTARDLCHEIGAHGEVNNGGAVSNWELGLSCPTWEQWLQIKVALMPMSDEMDAEVWRLNGRKGSPSDYYQQAEIVGEHDGVAPGLVGMRFDGDKTIRARSEAARQWQGYGTALKPAMENICHAQKPWDLRGFCGILAQKIAEAVCQLQSLAKDAEPSSPFSPSVFVADGFGSAQWSAVSKCNTLGALFDLMDTLPSGSALPSSLSIALSWLSTLAAIWTHASTFTIETETSLTTDLRTLNSLLSRNTPTIIAVAATRLSGSSAAVCPAASLFSALDARLSFTLELSALDLATLQEAPAFQGEVASEYATLARKSLSEKSVAANVLKWGTGALNIDGCRVATDENLNGGAYAKEGGRKALTGDEREGAAQGMWQAGKTAGREYEQPPGRWPANLCHDGSDEVVAGFPSETGNNWRADKSGGCEFFLGGDKRGITPGGQSDSGSAARFFYCAKATTEERGEGNKHPTVKPVALMRWLVRMVTPKGGTVLDPFMGSGSTGLACDAEQFNFIGCELSPEYAAIAERRIRDAAGMFADVKVAA